MFELIATTIGIGFAQFATSMIVNNSSEGNFIFNIGDVNTKINYNANLDMDRKHFHMTIDIDLDY